jgi:predicted nucleic acid-binding protein
VSAERVLVDTSVWVEYFRRGNPDLSARLDQLMEEGRICIPAIVLAELIQGARTEPEIRTIEDLKDAFTVIDQKEGTWIEAGKLSYSLRRKGKSIHLTDCYIALIARENGCGILTRDAHFRDIGEVLDIKLSLV